jgi:hypothetical protein
MLELRGLDPINQGVISRAATMWQCHLSSSPYPARGRILHASPDARSFAMCIRSVAKLHINPTTTAQYLDTGKSIVRTIVRPIGVAELSRIGSRRRRCAPPRRARRRALPWEARPGAGAPCERCDTALTRTAIRHVRGPGAVLRPVVVAVAAARRVPPPVSDAASCLAFCYGVQFDGAGSSTRSGAPTGTMNVT